MCQIMKIMDGQFSFKKMIFNSLPVGGLCENGDNLTYFYKILLQLLYINLIFTHLVDICTF